MLYFANGAKQKLNYQMKSEDVSYGLGQKKPFNISSKKTFGLYNLNPFTFSSQQVDAFINIDT